MPDEIDPSELLGETLMPHAAEQTARIAKDGTRFVQYTSASAAISILRDRRVWMRNTSCMNDWSEVRFGLDRVLEAYASPLGQSFQQVLNEFHPNLTDELKRRFDPLAPAMVAQTYISCFSEHRDDEDEHGRLSMWRAYGADTGVAMVMNNHAFITPSDALNAWTTPVMYIRGNELIEQIDQIAENLIRNRTILELIPREELLQSVIQMLAFATVSIKHVGFEEEREWRVVYLPTLYASARLEEDHVIVRGVPQPVFKIPLQNYPDQGFTGAEPRELINRIIIGPTQYPVAVRSTFWAMLDKAGVDDPGTKVICSGIPLRC